jgi:two-component sensor histidine kinase
VQGLSPPGGDEHSRLAHIASGLPLLADLARGDACLYVSGPVPGTARVIAEAKSATVASICPDSWLDRTITALEEPAVVRALNRRNFATRNHRIRGEGQPTVQDVYPVRQGTQVIAALVLELGQVESDRQKRKSVVYRRAIDRLRRLLMAGQLPGAGNLSRLTDHDGPMVVSGSGQIAYISSTAEELYRKVGYAHSLLHHHLATLRTDESVFHRAMQTGMCVEQVVQEGPYTWLKRAVPLIGGDQQPIWNRVMGRLELPNPVILTVHDATEEAQRERELRIKSAMIQEIHHRVKNNLQTIAALLRLQARRTGSPEVGQMLQETINRILSIAVVHEFLAHQDATDVDMREVAQQIVGEVVRGILDPEKHVHFSLDAASVFLPTQQATSCALVLNELLHNTVEHGFAQRNEGHVQVRLDVVDGRVRLDVIDDGEGLAPGFDLRNGRNLGLQIVQTLVRDDLKGTFQLCNNPDRGARATVSFPSSGTG